jgi:hypothetical protein
MALSSAKTASQAMPSRRNGNEMIQTTGHRMSARSANGAHSANKTHQRTTVIRVFIEVKE